jgi:hypothetical protein
VRAVPFLLRLSMVSPGTSYGGRKADLKVSPNLQRPKVGHVQPLKSAKSVANKASIKREKAPMKGEVSGTVPAPGRHKAAANTWLVSLVAAGISKTEILVRILRGAPYAFQGTHRTSPV